MACCVQLCGLSSRVSAHPVSHKIYIRLDSQPVYNAKTHVFSVTGTIVNDSENELNNPAVYLKRSSRIDNNDTLTATLHSREFDSQFTSDPVNIPESIPAHSSSQFLISASTSPHKHNFLQLPSAGVYVFSLEAHMTAHNNPTNVKDLFSFTFPAKDPTQTTTIDSAAEHGLTRDYANVVKPQITFLDFHAPPSLFLGDLNADSTPHLTNKNLISSLEYGPLHNQLVLAEQIFHAKKVIPSLCLAIDPDLISTVLAVSQHYKINNTLFPPSTAAAHWLHRLAVLAPHFCIVSELYSNPDINFLAGLDTAHMVHFAAHASDIIQNTLHVRVDENTLFIGKQVLSDATVNALKDSGITTIIGNTEHECDSVKCIPINFYNESSTFDAHNPVESSLYEAVRLHLFLTEHHSSSAPVVMGLTAGTFEHDESLSYSLDEIERNFAFKEFAPLSFPQLLNSSAFYPLYIDSPPPQSPTHNNHSILTPTSYFTDSSLESDSENTLKYLDTLESLSKDTKHYAAAQSFYAPLRYNFLRAFSSFHSSYVPGESVDSTAQARQWVSAIKVTVQQLSHKISVITPTTTFALASKRSPIVVTVKNDLPVPIRVALAVQAPQGVVVRPVNNVPIPAVSQLQLKLETYTSYSRYTSIMVQLQTLKGKPINKPVRISIHANAYGRWFVIISSIAGIILVLLVIKRLICFFRVKNKKADNSHNPSPEQRRRTVSPLRLKKVSSASKLSDRDDI